MPPAWENKPLISSADTTEVKSIFLPSLYKETIVLKIILFLLS